MNGREWLPEHQATLEANPRLPAWRIAKLTGHSVFTIQERRRAAGTTPTPNRTHWSRRDWLLADASGLDFQT